MENQEGKGSFTLGRFINRSEYFRGFFGYF